MTGVQTCALPIYAKGSNAALDQAIALHEPLRNFLRQNTHEMTARAQTFAALKNILP